MRRKKTGTLVKRGILGLTFLFAVSFLSVNAAYPANVDVSVGADVSSAYVWRGITFNDEGVIQPYLDVSHKIGLGVNVWGNFDLGTFNGAVEGGEFSEVDLTFYYNVPIELLDLSVGYIEYLFPNSAVPNTGEVYFSVGKELIERLSTGITVYFDVDEVRGVYGNANVSYAIPVNEKLSFDIGASFGAADKDFAVSAGGKEGGFFDYNISLTGSYSITDNLSVAAFLRYTNSLDTDVLPDQRTDIHGGMGISYSF
jgi:uncharacterized protein (TIGR02001 family)